MNIEKMSPHKLKIYISDADMQEWKMSPEMLTYNSPEAQMLFNDIIMRARAEHDFICDGANVVIEAVPDSDKGIKVTLTVCDETAISMPASSITHTKQKRIVLKFTNILDVMTACNSLLKIYKGQSHLFKYEGCYYIVLQTEAIAYTSIYDLGEIVDDPDLFYGYLNEFGDAVVRNDFLTKSA
ncbi:MAG: adaptor protein MecA [Oscillospiraceae bacterium]|nr:adaptor protein MecA [Oscillospiraceae bacterium]